MLPVVDESNQLLEINDFLSFANDPCHFREVNPQKVGMVWEALTNTNEVTQQSKQTHLKETEITMVCHSQPPTHHHHGDNLWHYHKTGICIVRCVYRSDLWQQCVCVMWKGDRLHGVVGYLTESVNRVWSRWNRQFREKGINTTTKTSQHHNISPRLSITKEMVKNTQCRKWIGEEKNGKTDLALTISSIKERERDYDRRQKGYVCVPLCMSTMWNVCLNK